MQFNKGDLVLVSTKNLRLKTPSKKLSQRMMGPFRGAARQYLVKWVGYPEDFNQWTLKKDMGNSSKLIEEFESRAARTEPAQTQRPTGNDPEELGPQSGPVLRRT
ncbi:hypothetical protein E6O75_ATG09785 [Venturia nashicola]|uniref:Chromo domain-containing protein n=1 Tax=Venturia nashicola TaxID=86259 RepID=A0A4Z1NMB8_9PEZI|nr:hypothetical protein E6O75_ATG09785 [Venturia nashicola]